MSLSHKHPECTGRWSFRSVNWTPYWKCDRCGAISSDCRESHEAAILENSMGNTLDQLTKKGRELLEGA